MPDYTNENDYAQQAWEAEEARRRVEMDAQAAFDWLENADEAVRKFEEELEADTEVTVEAGGTNGGELTPEEAYVQEKLKAGRYVESSDVDAVRNKYAKPIEQLDARLVEAEKDGKKGTPEYDEIKKTRDKLVENRDAELQRLCDEAPEYSSAARRALKVRQLRNNDRGAAGREIKIYRKEENHGKLLTTTYGRNKVGELNRMVRQHEQRAASLKGQRANEQRRNLGHSAKEFLQGDAEHMFKGSVAMSLHAALFLLGKLSQAGNKAAQGILYLYALNKLNMDDVAALQKAIDDTANKKEKEKEGKAAEGDRFPEADNTNFPQSGNEVAGPPAVVAHGELTEGSSSVLLNCWETQKIPMDFGSPDLPSFEGMEKTHTYFADFDVLCVQGMFKDSGGNLQMGSVLLGTEQNIRRMYEDIGDFDPAEIDSLIAENAEKVEALGLESLMVENVQDAYADFCRANVVSHSETMAVRFANCRETQQDTPRETSMDSGSNRKNSRSGVEPVLEPGDVDVMDILGEEVKEESENCADENDVDAILAAYRHDPSLGDDLPAAGTGTVPDDGLDEGLWREFGEV